MLVVWIMGINNKTVNNLNNLVELEKKIGIKYIYAKYIKKKTRLPIFNF